MPFIGKPKQQTPPDLGAERAEKVSQHVAEVYVNRRKVGEFRGATRQEAMSKAEQEEAKYKGSRVSINMRQAPRSKDQH
jgi:hypothetical protein